MLSRTLGTHAGLCCRAQSPGSRRIVYHSQFLSLFSTLHISVLYVTSFFPLLENLLPRPVKHVARGYSSLLSIAVVRHHDPKRSGEERVPLASTLSRGGRVGEGEEARKELKAGWRKVELK